MKIKILSKTLILFIITISISFAGCSKDDSTTAPKNTIPEIPGYTLVWNDEFSGTAIDLTKWEHEVNGDGGGNNELQYYTALPTNSYTENGHLIIKAICENYQNKDGSITIPKALVPFMDGVKRIASLRG